MGFGAREVSKDSDHSVSDSFLFILVKSSEEEINGGIKLHSGDFILEAASWEELCKYFI